MHVRIEQTNVVTTNLIKDGSIIFPISNKKGTTSKTTSKQGNITFLIYSEMLKINILRNTSMLTTNINTHIKKFTQYTEIASAPIFRNKYESGNVSKITSAVQI